MKTLFLLSLSLIISLNLNARENPFEATNAYEEEAASIIEQYETEEEASIAAQEEQYIEQMQKKMSEVKDIKNENKVEQAVNKLVPALKEEKKFSEQEVKKLIKKAQIQTENRTKQIIKKELEKKEMVKPEQIVYVKPRADIIEDVQELKTKEILPFLKVEYNNEQFMIHTDHKVSKKFTLNKDNKIIIDYKAKLNFYTKREDLDSTDFLKIAVGNHKKERYFRVVLQVKENPSNYKVNYKDNLISIVKTNNM